MFRDNASHEYQPFASVASAFSIAGLFEILLVSILYCKSLAAATSVSC